MDRNQKDQLLALYPVGTRIEMIHMPEEPYPIPAGTRGTITFIDDLPNIHVKWDNGRSLSLVPDVDQFRVITDKE